MKTLINDLVAALHENLWQLFLRRVPAAKIFVKMAGLQQEKVVHDHLAFRTLNTTTGEQPAGIEAIGHILNVLNYTKVSTYSFPRQKLLAACFRHPDEIFPKIFISQLEVAELPHWAQFLIHDVVDETPYLLSDTAIELLGLLKGKTAITAEAAKILVKELEKYFQRPWKTPPMDTIFKINDISQYAAWVLIHGNAVSHYAFLAENIKVEGLNTLESIAEALQKWGVAINEGIIDEKGGQLRQLATQASKEAIAFPDGLGDFDEMDWTYSYLEFIERGWEETAAGKKRFEGFLTEHECKLFKLTQTLDH